MARIPFQKKTEQYIAMKRESDRAGESMDCSVQALATACGLTYKEVHGAANFTGREKGRGLHIYQMKQVARALGFEMKNVTQRDMISQYPKPHNGLQSITTHHPDRFWKVWQDGKSYIFSVDEHVSAVVNGVNHDWTRGKAHRLQGLYEIVKK